MVGVGHLFVIRTVAPFSGGDNATRTARHRWRRGTVGRNAAANGRGDGLAMWPMRPTSRLRPEVSAPT